VKKKVAFTIPIQGREPPPLEDATLAGIEELGFDDPYAANQKRIALEMDPKKAQAILEQLAFVVGEVLPNPNYGAAKTKKERDAVEAQHSRIVNAMFQRRETITTLHRIAAADLDFQARTFADLQKLPKDFREPVLAAITLAPTLVPALAGHLLKAFHERSDRAHLGARMLFQTNEAISEIGVVLASVDEKKRAWLDHAKMLVQVGTSINAWAKAPDAWKRVLEPLLALMDGWSPAQGDLGRARFQLGFAAKAALESLDPKKSEPPWLRKKKAKIGITKAPIDKKHLRTAKGREKALDELGAWIVTKLEKADDDDAARAVMAGAIGAFYDIRESADQERGEYAGHFFMVDAVGLDDAKRPVPWQVLRKKLGDERLDELSAIFEEVEPEIS
jgi:hypothetical protein